MKKSFKTHYFYLAGAFIVFAIGSLILQNLLAILWLAIFVLLFTGTVISLMKKVEFLEKQNNINLERFTVSLEHVSNVLFDNVLEADITNDCLIGENTNKLTKLLGIPAESSYSQTIEVISQKMVHPDYSEEYRNKLSTDHILELLSQGSNTFEYECIERSDGENYRWIRLHYCIYKSNATDCVKVISYVKNIEDEKRAFSRLIEKATMDQMTGVLNKMSTKEIIVDLLKKQVEETNIILMIDIDNFKNINDVYGHDVGDEVIIAICQLIKNNFRDTDIIGRMGGDEFLVCLRENFNYDIIETKISPLLSAVEQTCIEINGQIVKEVTVSIGVVNTFGNDNFDQLYHYADVAMYKAKANGKNQYYVYDYVD